MNNMNNMNSSNGMYGGNASGSTPASTVSSAKVESSMPGDKKCTKRNIFIVGGIIVLVIVGFLAGGRLKGKHYAGTRTTESAQNMVTVLGKVDHNLEGKNLLNYSFDIPETASSTVSEEGDLVKVADATGTRATVYFSYEGTRNMTPSEYIGEIVAPHVPAIDETGTTTIAGYDWQLAETAGSNWYITTLHNGEWIVAVEAKKTWSDNTEKLISSFKAE